MSQTEELSELGKYQERSTFQASSLPTIKFATRRIKVFLFYLVGMELGRFAPALSQFGVEELRSAEC